jgi:hypothetical protein
LFSESGKDILAEYFKFHLQQKDERILDFKFRTYEEVALTLDKLASHLQSLKEIQKIIELEPLLCKKPILIIKVVFFSFLSDQLITKDALSKVSRSFFKEFKMNFRRFPFSTHLIVTTIMKFFEYSPSDTVRTFVIFNVIILCETLAAEQFNMAVTVSREKNFMT